MLTPSGGLYQLTPYEGMRVSVASMTAISGTNGSITSANEPTETATSTGYFYAVITGTARPFREPGIDIRDVPIPGAPTGIARLRRQPRAHPRRLHIAGGTSLEISTGAVLPNVTGVLDFTFSSSDSFYDPSRLILDATYDRTQVTGGMTVQPVPVSPRQSVHRRLLQRRTLLQHQSATDDLYYVPAGVTGFNGNSSTGTISTGQTFTSAAVDITSAAYTRRLQKVSLAIRNVLNTPDIVTLEEVENQIRRQRHRRPDQHRRRRPQPLHRLQHRQLHLLHAGRHRHLRRLPRQEQHRRQAQRHPVRPERTFTPTGSTNPITLNDRPWLVLRPASSAAPTRTIPSPSSSTT